MYNMSSVLWTQIMNFAVFYLKYKEINYFLCKEKPRKNGVSASFDSLIFEHALSLY